MQRKDRRVGRVAGDPKQSMYPGSANGVEAVVGAEKLTAVSIFSGESF